MVQGKVTETILVVGGGISGITTAIEAAEVGHDVILLEKNPYLGGRVAQMHQYFPKLCPPSCGLEINFRRMKQNRHVRFFTMAEVESISGEEGNYEVTVRLNPRYVNEKCTACGRCAEVATTEVPNPFNFGMDTVKAAYLPYEMAFPMRYVLAPEILGTEEAQRCAEACAYGAIELDMEPKTFTLNVSSIVWATGWKPYDAEKIQPYGFGRIPNVITNVMMERLAAQNGPTGGKIVRPSDGKEPQEIAFIQCAGSRDENHLAYCSRVCCLGSLKQTTYVRQQYPDAKMTIFYIDIRVHDKLESFYQRVKGDEGVRFVRSKVTNIVEDPETGKVIVIGEETTSGDRYREAFDLVVLATGMEPTTKEVALPGTTRDDYGFVLPASNGGFCATGCATAPLDVSMSVQAGTAAALHAIQLVEGK